MAGNVRQSQNTLNVQKVQTRPPHKSLTLAPNLPLIGGMRVRVDGPGTAREEVSKRRKADPARVHRIVFKDGKLFVFSESRRDFIAELTAKVHSKI